MRLPVVDHNTRFAAKLLVILPTGNHHRLAVMMLAAIIHLAILASHLFACSCAWNPTEISPSIILLGEFDWKPYGTSGVSSRTSRCTSMVDRALKYGSSRINFVPTHYYTESASAGGQVLGYCYMDSSYSTCKPFDQVDIQSFQNGMSLCLAHAAKAGMESVSIIPHLDSASVGATWTIQSWRNGIVFDPGARYSGNSYEEIMLRPLAVALGSSLPPSVDIYFALQGEMGATIFRYPKEYRMLLSSMKQVVLEARERQPVSNVEGKLIAYAGVSPGKISMGATFNFIFIDGNQAPDNVAAPNRAGFRGIFGVLGPLMDNLASFFLGPFYGMRQAPKDTPAFDKQAVQDLFSDFNFIGISAYSPLKVDFTTDQLQDSAFSFLNEADAAIGINVAAMMQKKGVEMQYVEYGVGGGTVDTGSRPANTAEQVAGKPYWGVFGPYKKSRDPWQQTQLRVFLVNFWSKTSSWLKQGGGRTHHITACYMWNLASWDVLAVYPESTSTEGTYLNEDVAALLTKHNQYARTGGR